MKLEYKIPKGWRQIKAGTMTRKGDKWADEYTFRWVAVNASPSQAHRDETIIRRRAKT